MRQSYGFCWTIVNLAIVLLPAPAAVAEPPRDSLERDYQDELPRVAPVAPEGALKTFHVAAGFRIEQVAAEPLVTDPVAAAFDEEGRLYVVEMRDYSEQDQEQLGRIRLLEDTDGDGRFDKSSLFAESLSWPTAIICYDGGVFVGAAPNIWWMRDNDGDHAADEKRIVFTGFERTNVQGLLNSFAWGLDNRIHVAVSSSGAQVQRVDEQGRPQGEPLSLRGRDFAFDPRTLAMEATSGGGQHGLSFDDWGRKFVCHNSDHIQLVMVEDRHLARNPYLASPNPRVSIAADGPQADVYRTSPVEPWREVRTRLRKQGIVPGPVEGGGRAAGYFTGATGITIYRGHAWPAEWRGLAIVGDVGGNLVHRKRLKPKGLELAAERIDDASEFVSSSDIWFRPVQFLNAPDGTLYVLDMYREVIEHPASLHPVIKKHLDLTSGRDRGRIYRIVPETFEQPPLPHLRQAKTEELVALLAHENGWHRDTAARLLYERQDRKAVPLLEKLALASKSPLGRVHAMYSYMGIDAQVHDLLARLAGDADPRVRQHAVRLAEEAWLGWPPLRAKLLALVKDEDPQVRYQLALTLGALTGVERDAALVELIQRDGHDRWVQTAIQSSLATGAGSVLVRLISDNDFRETEAGQAWIGRLAVQIARQQRPEDIAALVKAVGELPESDRVTLPAIIGSTRSINRRFFDYLEKATQGQSKEIIERLVQEALATARDAEKPVTERIVALGTLQLRYSAEAVETLLASLAIDQPPEIQQAALQTLLAYDSQAVSYAIVARWSQLSPSLRKQAIDGLASSDLGASFLVTIAHRKGLALSELEPRVWQLLASHRSAAVRREAERLMKTLDVSRRADVVAQYADALKLPGDAGRGKAVFEKNCASCHQVGGIGKAIGPNLAAMKNRGAEAILVNVLDPNRELNPQYVTYAVTTKDGRTLSGMIAAETATSLKLQRAENATDDVLRIDIEELRSTGLSLMPEGLEREITLEQMADLLAFLLREE